MTRLTTIAAVFFCALGQAALADVGDPQIRTDHPWYPGELACSSFDRLFATQADVYERVVGTRPETPEQKALAAWLWRNTHYWHGEEGAEDLWGKGFGKGGDTRNREYWTGLFAHGFGLCGTTHSQWVAEMEALLGHCSGRGVGVEGHNAFEVFLTGGAYGKGKWALLDHDISTVIFNSEGTALLSLAEIQKDWKRLATRSYLPNRQPWLVSGLHPEDGSAYKRYDVAEYLAGYSGPPPMVHLRRGETLRRYFKPGLEDGKTFVFWGRNYNTAGIPGPERSLTWVNQPDKMFKSQTGTTHTPGQARYANAVYTYKPDFSSNDYKEGVIAEDDRNVVFEFYTPYIIGATPPNGQPWGIYDAGCRNGLVLRGKTNCGVSISTDQGSTWQACGNFMDELDLTDRVKGRRQYLLKLEAGAKQLRDAGVTMVTVCQANSSVLPRLKDGGTTVTFQASGQGVVSAGPNLQQAAAHVVAGKFGSPQVTMQLASPRGEPITTIHAAAHVQSGNPPNSAIKYQIQSSTDAGKSWRSIVKDWTISRRGDEPKDFWSQSLCWGSTILNGPNLDPIQVRFTNNGGRNYARCEVHLLYGTPGHDATKVTYSWSDDKGPHQTSHVFTTGLNQAATWTIATAQRTNTHWVELEPVPVIPLPQSRRTKH